MTTGFCANCHAETTVRRVRLADVGLRFMCQPCADRLSEMGLYLVPVTIEDPRQEDLGYAARRQPGAGLRWAPSLGLGAWLRGKAA